MKPMLIAAAVLAVITATSIAPAQAGKWYVAETIIDHCSGDVVVKKPWSDTTPFTNPNSDKHDIILARSQAMCNLIGVNGTQGVCGIGHWTNLVDYESIDNSDDRFRWFCGMTKERSRCTSGTGKVRWMLGNERRLWTKCYKWDPTG